jgi:hypothetical protein
MLIAQSHGTYDKTTYGPLIGMGAMYVMLLMQVNPLLGQVGGRLGPGNRDFFGPSKIASSRQASAIWGAMDLPASKALRTEPYRSYM